LRSRLLKIRLGVLPEVHQEKGDNDGTEADCVEGSGQPRWSAAMMSDALFQLEPCVQMADARLDRYRGCLLGLAVGDALGTSVEFKPRGSFSPLTDMVGGGPFGLLPGQWTDDTALTLATIKSLATKGLFDPDDIRFNLLMAYKKDPSRGYGNTTRKALESTKRSKGKTYASNGAAMRIAPVALFSCSDLDALRTNVIQASIITHSHPEAINGALAVAFALASSVRGELKPKKIIAETIDFIGATTEMAFKLREVSDILNNRKTSIEEGLEHIGTRTNVLESVGSAFYAFLKTPENFPASVLNAVNAGGDTDTIGSLTGALSGAFNGIKAIPLKWINVLEDKHSLEELSWNLFEVTFTR